MEVLVIALAIALPLGIYFWRESRHRNPASRWPQLAAHVEFTYAADPPRLSGSWKGRRMTLTAGPGAALLSTPINAKAALRIELGPKAEVEKAAGIIVADRIQLNDSAFEKRYLLRSTPPEVGKAAVDPSMRQRILQLPDFRVLAQATRLEMRMPVPTESSELRAYFDIAAALADSIDGS